MAHSALPTRDHFLAHQISVIQNCSICQDDFDTDKHAPARLCGPNSCHHVFGASCLRKWLKSDMLGANKCPLCRRELFVSHNEESESEDEEAETGTFEYDELDAVQVDVDNDQASEQNDDVAGAYRTNLEDVYAPLPNPPRGSPSWSFNNVDRDSEDDDSDFMAFDDGEEDVMDVSPDNHLTSDDEESEFSEGGCPENIPQSEVLLPEREPVFCLGTRANEYWPDNCGSLSHWPDAATITDKIWKNLYSICNLYHIHEDDIEIQVHRALQHSDLRNDAFTIIWCNQWPKILEVGRDMVRQHFKNGKFVQLDDGATSNWLERLAEALDWNLCGEIGEACSLTDEEGPCTGTYRGDGW
ncbi:hypothetical protein P171DRAFT_486220 [Karstenula rhodostoma CBS 690.94]|uniref:RING-type domain-containing protein n=1 Tax=Karstenula rhodostoma CBS 690.94 TaxID=1392251 RepID=A0A9P4PHL6_9PLEO|nr:hypothetical protein P171DRAFT_486220 [Karstenula rhodostoma CBS 690.94]